MTDPAFPTAAFDGIESITLTPTPLAVVRRADVTLDDLRGLFDRAFGAIGSLIAQGAMIPTGPALAVYYGDPMGAFDLELGFPVGDAPATPLSGGGLEVIASTLPAGPAVATTYLGAYDGLSDAWADLVRRSRERPAQVWLEVYVSDPGGDPHAQRTDLIMPLDSGQRATS